ncbi:TRAP transporter small permease [Salinarimonas ramus]|uniref:TRAP transporter small permease protein n=1 Tax=Salinarimonas ramus TaxID=690164 RepID=A0A917Q4I6_9HYPH|nr:TRAP transporter small permease [Salinarimonas ramus]GGK20715.1 membrane protein [Salinarimonas ramus]
MSVGSAISRMLLRVLDVMRRIMQAATVACLAIMVVAITVQVVGRYLLPFPIADAVEISTFAQVWLVLLGAGLACRADALFTVDLLGSRLSPAMERVRRLLVLVAGSVFLGMLLWGSLALLELGARQRAPTLQISMWWIYVSLPIGVSYFWIELAMRCLAPRADATGEGNAR